MAVGHTWPQLSVCHPGPFVPFSDTLELCLRHGLPNCPDESQSKKCGAVRERVGCMGLEV